MNFVSLFDGMLIAESLSEHFSETVDCPPRMQVSLRYKEAERVRERS